jgi:thiosulfate/3-mercaptopyruvate sulfurtransferase
MISPLITAKELIALSENQNIVLIDASFDFARYQREHLSGALHVDLNKTLSQIEDNPADGGRHPLPEPSAFARSLAEMGITAESHVIVYDDKSAAMSAARFWWMLKALGHEKIQVLDGGMKAAIELGYPVSDKKETPDPAEPYPAENWKLPVADLNEVKQTASSTAHKIIDVRETERYQGIKEPIDLIAGHIPGADNIPFSENLDQNGFFLSKDLLKAKYEKYLGETPADHTIVHCGSGVTACHSLLAISYAGLPIPKLYVGSWSEWSRNDLPIAP